MSGAVVVRVCLAAAVLAAAASLVPVVAGPGWLVELTATLVVLTVVSVALGRLGLHPALLAVAQLLVLVEVLTVVHAPAQAVAGLLPGPAALAHAGELLEQAAAVVTGQSAPIDAVPGVRLATTGIGALVLVALDPVVVLARHPALAGVPLLLVHAVGAVFAPGGLGAAAFVLAAAGWLLLVLVAGRAGPRWGPVVAPAPTAARRAPGTAPLVVGGALVLALAVPAVAPLPSVPAFTTGGGGGGVGSVNPLLDLRADLEDRADTVVMTYETDQRDPQPLRVVTVDSFDGDLWRPGARADARPLRGGQDLRAPGLDPSTPREAHTLDLTLETLRQEYLPLPYPVTRVDVGGDWLVEPTTGTVVGAGRTRTRPGTRYDVDYVQVQPDPAVLAAAPPPPAEVVAAYAALPADLPPEIAETAAEVTAGAGTDHARAAALQEWFRGDGGFTYSEDSPEPTSPSALVDFLAERRGYCVHFSSAMAVMARSLGIPARVAVGFLPGRSTVDGWRVRGSDAHAWPELYFEGAGWTRFEPTPSVQTGAPPAWTVPAADPAPLEQQTPEQAPAPAPEQTQAQQSPAAADQDAGASADEEGTGWPLLGRALTVVAGVGVLIVLLGAPGLARRARSARRWRRARGADRAEAAWADLVERLGDLGMAPSPSATPRGVRDALEREMSAPGGSTARGRRAGHGRGRVAPGVDALVVALERARYGAGHASDGEHGSEGLGHDGGDDLRDRALGTVAALRGRVGRRRALAARWWPASGVAAILALPSALARAVVGRGPASRTSRGAPRTSRTGGPGSGAAGDQQARSRDGELVP